MLGAASGPGRGPPPGLPSPIVLLSLCIGVAPLPTLIGGWALCPGWETLTKLEGLRAEGRCGRGTKAERDSPGFPSSSATLAGGFASPVLDGGHSHPSHSSSSSREEVKGDRGQQRRVSPWLAWIPLPPHAGSPLPTRPHQTPLPPGLELELALLVVAAAWPDRQSRGEACRGPEVLGLRVAGGSQQEPARQGFVLFPQGALDGNFPSPRGTVTSSPGPST